MMIDKQQPNMHRMNTPLEAGIAWRSYDEASRELDKQKDALLDEISHRLEQHRETVELFTIRWGVK